jgi:hypothetical protein
LLSVFNLVIALSYINDAAFLVTRLLIVVLLSLALIIFRD